MKADFWHERWSSDQIAFHEAQVNPLLVRNFSALGFGTGSRIFVPLCGKTLDIDWLLSRGHRVVGAELSPIAVAQLFERLALTPQREVVGELKRISAGGLDVFVGDIFALTRAALGEVDAVYDRAALIALPAEMRKRYAAHLSTITNGAPQLLATVEYDQQSMSGPPFSVDANEVGSLYGARAPRLLESQAVQGGLKGHPALENVWMIDSAGSRFA